MARISVGRSRNRNISAGAEAGLVVVVVVAGAVMAEVKAMNEIRGKVRKLQD